MDALAQRIQSARPISLCFNDVMQIDGDFSRVQHPVAGLDEFERADHADRHDGNAELLRDAEDPFPERLHVAVAGARAFGKSNKADAGIEGCFARAGSYLRVPRLGTSGTGTLPKRLMSQP